MTIIVTKNYNILIKHILHLSFQSGISGIWNVSSHEDHLRKYSCSGYLVPRSSRNHWRSSIFWHISQLQSNYSNIDRLLGECKKLFTNQAKCITARYLTIMCCLYLHYGLWRMSDTWPSIKMSFYDKFSVRNAGWRISWQFLVAIWNRIRVDLDLNLNHIILSTVVGCLGGY